jgi:hypothetical protein
MTELEYLELITFGKICVLMQNDLLKPLKKVIMTRYRRPTSIAIYTDIEFGFPEFGEDVRFMENNSLDIANKLQKMLSEKLPKYSFEVDLAFSRTQHESLRDYLQLEEGMSSICDVSTTKRANLQIFKNNSPYGALLLLSFPSLNLCDPYGFKRELTWDRKKLISQVKEDILFSSIAIQNCLELLAANYFPKTKKIVESTKLTIKPDYEAGRKLEEQEYLLKREMRKKSERWYG